MKPKVGISLRISGGMALRLIRFKARRLACSIEIKQFTGSFKFEGFGTWPLSDVHKATIKRTVHANTAIKQLRES